MLRKILIILLLLLPASGIAQESTDITIGKNIKIKSAILGEERTIFVSTPIGYEGGTQSYPVMFVLDGSETRIRFVSGLLADLNERAKAPEMIVVAIANIDRLKDMTPTKAIINRQGKPVEYRGEYGKADNFLEFFDKELIPFMDKNYRTLPFRLLVGHSGSGIFVNHAFLASNDMFSAYIAASPTFFWGDYHFTRMAKEKLAGMDLKHKYYYSTIGGQESFLNIRDAEEAADTFEANAPEELTWKFVYMRGETHGSQFTGALLDGLKFIYDGWGYDYARMQSEGITYIDSFYKNQTAKYGYTISPSEAEMTSFGYALIRNRNFEDAIKIMEKCTGEYPKAANAFDSLGDVYMAAQKTDKAIAAYSKAVELGKENNDAALPVYIGNLEKAKEAKATK